MQSHTFERVIALILPAIFWAGGASGDEGTSPESTEAAGLECCSCDYLSTKIFPGNENFQCSFAYPAHWNVRYIATENDVDVRAPRCETRCPSSGSMVFSVSTGKDNNADVGEQSWQKNNTAVGTASCGGRALTVYRPRYMEINKVNGANIFHVGNNDGKAYDARVAYKCPQPREWQKLERLFTESLK